jgi:hypothetical protein
MNAINKHKRKPAPGSLGDLLNQYYVDLPAKIAYKFPYSWTDEDKQNFTPSFLPNRLQPDNASSLTVKRGSSQMTLQVISIPESPCPQRRVLKAKEVKELKT